MSDLRGLLDQQASLPALPSLEDIKAAAQRQLELGQAFIAEGEQMVDEAEAYLASLSGTKRRAPRGSGKKRSNHQLLESTYLIALTALGTHDYAGRVTIAQDTGLSEGHAGTAMNVAVDRGHALRSKNGRRHRYEITEAGRNHVNRQAQTTLTAVA